MRAALEQATPSFLHLLLGKLATNEGGAGGWQQQACRLTASCGDTGLNLRRPSVQLLCSLLLHSTTILVASSSIALIGRAACSRWFLALLSPILLVWSGAKACKLAEQRHSLAKLSILAFSANLESSSLAPMSPSGEVRFPP